MKKIVVLFVIVFLFTCILIGCNSESTITGTSNIPSKATGSVTPGDTNPATPDSTVTTNYIPTAPEDLAEILEDIGLEDVDVVDSGDFLGYGHLGNLECVVSGYLPGPQEDVVFFYCADTATADSIEDEYTQRIASTGENYYAVKRENNIVFFGPAEVWEDLTKFTPDSSEKPANPGSTVTTNYIPTDPEDLAKILEDIGLEDVDVVDSGDFLGYGHLGNLECVVSGYLPGPQEDVVFFYCADTATADSIEDEYTQRIASTGENYYAVKRENNIVFFGPAEVWEDLQLLTK